MTFEEVYQVYFHDVYVFALALTADAHQAEEVTQETFFKAMGAIDRFDGRKDIRAWLFTIARNTYFKQQRKAKRELPLEECVGEPAALEEALVDREEAFRVHQCVHDLPEPYKEVFSLRVFGELPFEKIGQLFGRNASWARVTYYRARKQLQGLMEVKEDE